MARRVVRTKTEQTLVRIARSIAWSGSLTTASLATPRVGAIPLGRVATTRGSLRRHAYATMVEAMMSRGKSGAKPEGLSQLNLNAAGIDVGATSHYVAVPADRAEQPVQEFEAFTADLYRLADWLTGCGVETVVMESTGVYWIPLFGVLEERGFQVDAGGPQAHQERARSQDRCAGLPVAATVAHLRTAVGSLPSRRGNPTSAQLSAAAGHAGAVRVPSRPTYAEGADPDERQTPPRHQRHHRQDRHGHHRGHNPGREESPQAGTAAATRGSSPTRRPSPSRCRGTGGRSTSSS